MNETKRGAPTEPGRYVVRRLYGCLEDEQIVDFDGKLLLWANAPVEMRGEILAHRKHEPLVVPELKKLPEIEKAKRCAVKMHDKVYLADKYTWKHELHYLVHCPETHVVPLHKLSGEVRELSREQCEAAGWDWPEGVS